MIKDRKLTILSEAENFALYGLPDFNNKQRREYFSFPENEMLLIMRSNYVHVNIHYALQIGYFKAKKMFFQFLWEDIIQEDLQFIVEHYFPGTEITKITVTKHKYYTQRRAIADLFGYKNFLYVLHEQASQIIRRDISPNFIARGLIAFLNDIKLVRPGYTTLQTIVSKNLVDERKRISSILDKELTNEQKSQLKQLMVSEGGIDLFLIKNTLNSIFTFFTTDILTYFYSSSTRK